MSSYFHRITFLFLCSFNTLLATNVYYSESEPVEQETSETIVYWHSGSPARYQFELEVTRLVLNKSVDNFGPYKFELHNNTYSAIRGHQELVKGKFHFTAAGDWIDKGVQQSQYKRVPIPVWNGIQGYRQLMIHKENLHLFKNIKSLEQLRKYKPGQGENWTEVLIYQDNGFEVVTAVKLKNLYPMLAYKRFDFLPLGINEIQSSLANAQTDYRDITVVPNLLIYYPLNIYFQVGKQYPQLAARIEYGFMKAKNDGSYQALIENYLKDYYEIINSQDVTIVNLINKRTN